MLVAVRQEAWHLVLKLLHHQPVIQIVPIFHNHLYILFTVLPTTVYSFHSDATIKCVLVLVLSLYKSDSVSTLFGEDVHTFFHLTCIVLSENGI
jgi:hypothetical protein